MLRNAVSKSGVGIVSVACALLACGSEAASRFQGVAEGNAATEAPGAGGLGGSEPDVAGSPTCAAKIKSATRAEVDIIVVIDTSGSMDEETAQVQQNINNFAKAIGNTGLDYNVIMIATKPKKVFGLPLASGICTPAPLGGPNCGDNLPRYHHVDQEIDSVNSLSQILSTYDAEWKVYARPNAYKVFIEISDDNSDMKWEDFDKKLLAKPNGVFGDATNRKYIFNSIVGWSEGTAPLAGTKCGTAENIGDQYQHLSVLTKGTIDSVCKTSYANVFNHIAQGLLNTLGCEFAMPVADGATDPSAVAVKYTRGGANSATSLTRVTDVSKCQTIAEGWYYDNNDAPTKIIFCPALCNSAGKDTSGKLEVALGCKTEGPR